MYNFFSIQAREAVEMRAQLEKKLAQKEKEKKEEHLRALAQKAREERAGIRTGAPLAGNFGKYRRFLNRSRKKVLSSWARKGCPQ